MKTSRLITCCIGLAVLVTIGSSRAYAQAEIDPDHYETGDARPLPQSSSSVTAQVAIHYQGNFTLPYSVQCGGAIRLLANTQSQLIPREEKLFALLLADKAIL